LGLPAVVTVDALPGQTFFGSVGRIAPLPDPQSMWMNPDLKVYNSEVYLEGDTPNLRTGMSCKVEIIVQQYEDVVYIPIQAVIRIAGQPAVYVVNEGTIEEREVKIGLDNNRMVRIVDGIQEGEVVLLTPPLKSATIDESLGINSGRPESSGEMEALKQRINEQLNGTNGKQTERPDAPLDMEERRKMQQQLLGAGKEQGEGGPEPGRNPGQGRNARPQGSERNR